MIGVILILLSNQNVFNTFLQKKSRHRDPYITYQTGITKSTIKECRSLKTVCNIVHKRFWLSPMVVRMCNCPDNSECPFEWVDNDEHTIYLNNRAQLKFCGEVGRINKCQLDEVSLVIQDHKIDGNRAIKISEVRCFCPIRHYFNILYTNASETKIGGKIIKQFYSCKQLHTCSAGKFCGYITANYYETYHTCRCPRNHMCIMVNKRKKHAVEALYDGDAYVGRCTPK
ncbi:Uncharacterised protein g3665 [Pycnogonum litorale]